MKKVLLGLVVAGLVVGIAGYMFQGYIDRPSYGPAHSSGNPEERDYAEKEKLWNEGCNKTGLALIRYNGSLVEARYYMYPNFRWGEGGRKIWYCDVGVTFLRPIKVNGTLLGGFGVPLEEFESKYLVRYLSGNTGGAPVPLLESLNGVWMSAGGEALTEWWNNVSGVKASQIWGYIDSLWDRMQNTDKYYNYMFSSSHWSVPPKPLPNQTVKVHSIRLWFGARLDILAYQNPADPGVLEVVMYATIEDTAKWYDGIARLATFNGLIPTWSGRRNNDLWGVYSDVPGFGLATSIGYGFANSLISTFVHLEGGKNEPVKLAVWQVKPQTEGGYLMVDNDTILSVNAYWVLDEPLLTGIYPAPSQELFWLVVGAPVFQLTGNLVLPQHFRYSDYAAWVRDIIHSMLPVKENSVYPGFSPATVLLEGSVSAGYSWASAMIANLAGGLPVSIITFLPASNSDRAGPTVSLIVFPSRTENATGIELFFDVDGDGLNDTAIVLYDTAHFVVEELLSEMQWRPMKEAVVPPYKLAAGIADGDIMTAAGLTYYPSALGKPFIFDIIDKVNEEITSEIPWAETNGYRVIFKDIVPSPANITSPNANATMLSETYLWKICAEIPIEIPRNVTPEWLLYNVILPAAESRIPTDIQRSDCNKTLTLPITFVQKEFKVAIEHIWGYPENYAPLSPPVTPAEIPGPAPLDQLYPQLSNTTFST